MVAFLLFQPKADITNGLYSGQSRGFFQDPAGLVASGSGGSEISNALQTAAQQTGAGFDYLLRTAMQESSMRPNAQASTSSATGLFQFIESTWLRTVKSDGARFGLESFANNIEANSSGKYTVRDPQTRTDILALRNDPGISALMAGALAEDNANALSSSLGRTPNDGELYIAHFLGARGAGQLIQLSETRPGANAVGAFPDPARANKAIFYNGNGTPRTVGEVYRVLVQKHHAAEQPAKAALNNLDAVETPVAPSRSTRFGSLFEGLFHAIVGSGKKPAARDFGGSLFTSTGQVNGQVNGQIDQQVPVASLGVQSTQQPSLEIARASSDANQAYLRHTDWISTDFGKDDPASWI